jgi:LmbE family N-acetylglucosaminyl deacetylase
MDDAVLSAWHVLSSAGDAAVVTVFAGIPNSGFVTALDRNRGGSESAAVVRRRRAEDRRALAHAGRKAVHLDLLDADYRVFELQDLRARIESDPTQFIPLSAGDPRIAVAPGEVMERLRGTLLDGDVVYAPLGVGGHPDHRDVARVATELARRDTRVYLYGDIPYLMRAGLPQVLTGHPNPDADALIDAALARLPSAEIGERCVVVLSPAEVERKLAAIRCYETEFEPVNADFGGVLDDRARMRYEVYWRLVITDAAHEQ